jgi:hypothetical protein
MTAKPGQQPPKSNNRKRPLNDGENNISSSQTKSARFDTSNSKQQTLKNFDSYNLDAPSTEIDKENEFQVKGPRKKHTKPNQFISKLGTGTVGINGIRTNPRKQLVFIGRLHPETSIVEVEGLLKQISFNNKNLEFDTIEKITLNHDRSAAFHFQIPFSSRDVVRDKSLWPADMIVDFSFKPRAPLANINSQQSIASSTSSSQTQK